MGGERCWRCGLGRLETDVRCLGCGAAFGPAAARRRAAGAGPPRIMLGRAAVLAVREEVAPAGVLFNVTRFYLGAASAFLLLFWAYGVTTLAILYSAPKIIVYTAPFMVYPAVTLYCCVRLLPARRVAALGLFAHAFMLVSTLVAGFILGDRATSGDNGGSLFGWALTLSLLAAWAALYAGRVMDEGRLRVRPATQTALGVALIIVTVAALGWSDGADRRARERRLETRTYERR